MSKKQRDTKPDKELVYVAWPKGVPTRMGWNSWVKGKGWARDYCDVKQAGRHIIFTHPGTGREIRVPLAYCIVEYEAAKES